MIFGTLTGRFTTTIRAGSGSTSLVPLDGYVEIEPAISHVTVDGVSALPTIHKLPLTDGAIQPIELLATDNPGQVPPQWLYRCEPHFTFQRKSVQFKSFYFGLPGNTTTDLTTLTPVPWPGRLMIAVPPGPKGDKGDNANVVLVDSFDDVTEPLPAGTLVVLTPR